MYQTLGAGILGPTTARSILGPTQPRTILGPTRQRTILSPAPPRVTPGPAAVAASPTALLRTVPTSQTLPYHGPPVFTAPSGFKPADNTMPATVTAPAAPPGAQGTYQTAQVAASQGGMAFDAPAPTAAAAGAPAGGKIALIALGLLGLVLLFKRKGK